MDLEIIGPIVDVELIATGSAIREHRRLVRAYGGKRWRKLKGRATIRLASDRICLAEIHWYEAHGVGRREFKLKRIIEFA